jgi:hypothetical protein
MSEPTMTKQSSYSVETSLAFRGKLESQRQFHGHRAT